MVLNQNNKMNYGNRRSIRLKGYDYSQPGAYFITVCTNNKECILGDIIGKKMVLNELGNAVKNSWSQIPGHFPHVSLDHMVIMPNHIHGILLFSDSTTTNNNPKNGTSKTLGSVVRGFKVGVTKWARNNNLGDVWQRNYYEHIIRDKSSYDFIYEYIENNPLKWELDSLHPNNGK